MRSNTVVVEDPAGEASAADLGALEAKVREADRLIAEAVVLAGRLAGSGVAERAEHMSLELFLANACRMTGADRSTLITAGEVLTDLPTVAGLFNAGDLSWGQVRAVTRAARRLSRADRAALDSRVAATVEDRGGVDAFDPDDLVWAVDAAVEDLRGARTVERAERRAEQGNRLSIQEAFDGRVDGSFSVDALTGAMIVNAISDAADRPAGCGGDAEGDRDGDAPTRRQGQLARGLERVCAAWLGGGEERPARPLVVCHVDLSNRTTVTPGTVELPLRGDLPRLSAAAVESMVASGADVRTVLFDGKRPLAVTKKVTAEDIPADTAVAVRARDLGDRMPGSRDPLDHCDLHHIRERGDGGGHDPDNIVAWSGRHHRRALQKWRWTITLDARTGEITMSNGKRRWRSLPKGTRLSEPRGDPPPTTPPDGLPF